MARERKAQLRTLVFGSFFLFVSAFAQGAASGSGSNTTGKFTASYTRAPSYHDEAQLRVSRDGKLVATYSVGTSAGSKVITVGGSGSYSVVHWSRKKERCLVSGRNGICYEPEPGTPWQSRGGFTVAVNIPKPGVISLGTRSTSGSYAIRWGAASGSPSRYELQERKNGGSWSTIHSATSRSKSISGKLTGKYDYRVRACYVACSAFTAIKTVTVVRTPGSVTAPASSTNGSIAISWASVSGAASYKLQQQKNGGAWADVYSATAPSTRLTGRGTGTYKYRVATIFNGVTGAYKASGNVIVSRAPGVPNGFSVPGSSANGVYSVSWDAVSGAGSYLLNESGASTGNWIQVGTKKSFTKTKNGSYTYKVRACSTYGGVESCSGFSGSKTMRINLPELWVQSVSTTGAVKLVWNTSWPKAERCELKRSGKTILSSVMSAGATYSDNISSSGTYSYAYSCQRCLQGSFPSCYEPDPVGFASASAVVIIKPNTPTLAASSANSYDGRTRLTSSSSGPIDIVRWQKRLSTGSWPADTSYQTASSSTFEAAGLADGTWQFRTKNCNTSGCSGSWSNIVSVAVWNQPIPSKPTLGQLQNDDDGKFTLKWTDLKAEHVYKYEIRENGKLIKTLTSSSQNPSTSFTYQPPVRDDGSYSYTVKACNLRGCTSSNVMSLMVAHRPGAPAAITPSVLFTRTGSVRVGWNSASGKVKRYELFQGTAEDGDGPVTWSNASKAAHTDLQKLKLSYTLDDGFHAFKVRACNQVSSYSTCSGYAESKIVQVAVSEPPVAVEISPHQETAPLKTSAEVQASDSVGVVGGEFRVSESGSVNYSIPIVIGPASGGAVPSLSLNYSSESGNGPLGMGWNIGGLSAISACRRTKEEDGINGSAFDRYCLDGQRLVLVSGSQGAVGSMYRTSLDPFVRVKLVSTIVGSGKGFEVYRKDGSISYYGSNEDSYETNVWYLGEQVDSAGNRIEYEYIKDATNGEHLIGKVHYSGNDYDSTANVIEFSYDTNRTDKIFGYAFGAKKSMTRRLTSVVSKADGVELRRYVPEYETSDTGRLRMASIEECVGSNCRPATSFDYAELEGKGFSTYTIDTGLLHSAYEGGKLGDVNGDGRADLVFIRKDGNGKRYIRIALGQANGNLALQAAQLRVRSNTRREWHLIDYNDDGKDDFLHVPTVDDAGHWTVNYSLGNSFSTSEVATSIAYVKDQRGQMFDLNADGLPDFIKRQTVYDMERVTGGGLKLSSSPRALSLPAPATSKPGPLYEKTTQMLRDTAVTADFNGDGIADLDAIYYIVWDCTENVNDAPKACPGGQKVTHNLLVSYLSAGGNNYSILSAGTTFRQEFDDEYNSDRRFVDLNGDGLTDRLSHSGGIGQWSVSYFTGTGFANSQLLPVESEKLQLYDWNNDGLLDIVYPDIDNKIASNHYRMKVLINNSAGFNAPVATVFDFGASKYDHFHYPMDLNGDGLPELVEICANANETGNACDDYLGNNDKYLRIFKNKHNNKPVDVLTHITNGFGVKTEIQYARLNDPAAKVYTRRTGSSALNYGKGSPVFDLYAPMYVVKKVISDAPAANDDNNTVEALYHYTGARMQSGGRGFLGFERITTYDPQNQVKSTTRYRQDYPYIGMPVETAKVIEPNAANIHIPATCSGSSLTLISCSTNTPALVEPIAGKTKLTYISKAIDKSYDIDGTYLGRVETQTIYDPASGDQNDVRYGNVSKLIVTHFDAAGTKLQSKTTTNIYSNVVDGSRWHLARLTKSTVATQRFGSLASPAITRHADFAYDPDTGLLTDEWVEKGTAFALHTRYGHDRFGNRTETTVTDAAGNSRTSKVIYDGLGRYPVSQVNALEQTTAQVVEADAYGQPLLSLDMDGASTTRDTSQFGEAYFEHHETGSHSTTLKAMCESCITVAGVPSHFKVTAKGIDQTETVVYHDRLGREIRKQTQDFHGNPVYVDTQYDEQSRVYKVSEPYGPSQSPRWIVYSYDKLGRTTLANAPAGQCDASTVYNGFSETTTACGQSKTTKKNALGEVAEVTDNIGGKLQYSYYSDGQLKSVKVLDSSGVQTSLTAIEYDQLGRKEKLVDPDKGTWTYGYTGFGELKWQKDAKGQGTAMSYDKLGRMVTRADYTGFDSQTQSGTLQNFSRWYFDQDITCASENRFDGKLLAVAQAKVAIQAGCSPNVEDITYLKLFRHDRYGRLGETTTAIGALTESEGDFYEKISYDQYSRAHKTYDAANQQVAQGGGYLYGTETVYNPYGYKRQIKNLETGGSYYTVSDMNVRGQVKEIKLGNGLTTTYEYDSQSHRLTDILTDVMPGVGQVQNLHYDWDTIGNLMSKTDQSGDGSYQKDLQEAYQYDGLNRLRYARLYLGGSLTHTQEVSYYDNGNIKTKTGVGIYAYGSSRPHAVTNTSTGNVGYRYDGNGNLVSDDNGRRLAYAVFDKPAEISKGSHSTTFAYAPDRSRYRRVDNNGSGTVTTLQIGSMEKVVQRSNGGAFVKAYYRRSIAGVAVEKMDLDQGEKVIARNLQYLHKDLQGSLDVITTSIGQVASENGHKQVFSFDAWGKRRNALTWAQLGTPENIVSTLKVGTFNHLSTNRGYTGHEMLDETGLIHMNGRVYDPTLARFVSADPVIDGVTSTQGFNRYAYVHNNPLLYMDPTGYSRWNEYRDSVVKPVAAIIITIYTGGTAAGAAWGFFGTSVTAGQAIAAVAIGGAASGALQTGTLKGAFVGAFSAMTFYGIGSAFQGAQWVQAAKGTSGVFGSGLNAGGFAAKVFAHAVAGGVMGDLQGGKFAHGFASAGITQAFSGGIDSVDTGNTGFSMARVIAAAIVGGTASVASGGKFANGAITGAFSRAFNGELHREGGLLKKPENLQLKDLIDGEINLEINKGAIKVNDKLEVEVDITKLAEDNLSPLSAAVDSKGQGTVTLGKEINVGLAKVGASGVLKTDGSIGAEGTIGVGNAAVTAQGTVNVVKPYVWTWETYLHTEYENAKQNIQGWFE